MASKFIASNPAATMVNQSKMKNSISIMIGLVLALFLLSAPSSAQIYNIDEFLEICPHEDPLFAEFVDTFSVLKNLDQVDLATISCTTPISTIPVADYPEELIVLVALRAIFYMDRNQVGHLPWTNKSLFDWMSEQVDGFHITEDISAGGACCSTIDGKKYILLPERSDERRDYFRNWENLLITISLYIHEARHLEGPRHANTFSNLPDCKCVNLVSCDVEYDLANLGSYGVEYFFRNLLLTGGINVGLANLSHQRRNNIASGLLTNINGFAERNFCTAQPPTITLPENPGGVLSISSDVQEIFWGIETLQPESFTGGSELRSVEGFIYRYFTSSGIYVGIFEGGVYVVGGGFGDDVVKVGSIEEILQLVRSLLN